MATTPDPRLEQSLTQVREYVQELRETAAAADAKAADLEQQLADALAHAQGTQGTRFGGCPPGGGTSLAAAQSVIDKWGPGAAVRMFLATSKAPRPAKASVLHASWKPTLAQITPTWVANVVADLKPRDRAEVWHEADRKVRLGSMTKADVVGRKNKFYDVVKEVRPDLRVVNTLTGQALSDYGHDEWTQWGVVRADDLGLDADGVHDKTTPLDIRYEDEVERVTAFLAANPSYTGWVVPEFGTSRPGWDFKGLERAAWAAKYGRLFQSRGAGYVCLYDYESTPGNQFKAGTPEYDEWNALVDVNAA